MVKILFYLSLSIEDQADKKSIDRNDFNRIIIKAKYISNFIS